MSGAALRPAAAPAAPPEAPPPLSAQARARGRRLAITSHPFGMTFQTVSLEWVPTLALVGLGAGEAIVGLQSAFDPLGTLIMLFVLRWVGRLSKRALLVGGWAAALVAALPMLGYAKLHAAAGPGSVAIALASLAATAAGLAVSNTVWYPLLRGYMEPGQVGRFFGMLRSAWHLTLIAYFLGARFWLAHHPGDLAPLFGVGIAAGVVRGLIALRLPERRETPGVRIRARRALSLVRTQPALRRYLLGVGGQGALWAATAPFVIVLMRRVLGFSEAEVLWTTVATYAGGLLSLVPWGHAVDVLGPARIFRWTALGLALCLLALLGASGPGPGTVAGMACFFFVAAVLRAGFGVADTHVLFGLAPAESPSGLLVAATALSYLPRALAPVAVGFLLDAALGAGTAPLAAYRVLFVTAAALQALVFLPLRGFGRPTE